ncbi:MAG: sulfite exporter TauE/SafE family protein [Paludibacteraceae bacterium]|nr:sulfite exporter TauE/SafE family protein [Paludibacteraceae bacterium]
MIIYVIIGVLVGCLGAMAGIGGGVIIVPLLSFFFGFSPQMAVGTSMFVVFINSLSGSIGYIRRRMVCWDAAWKFAIATIPGAFLGGYVADFMQGKVFFIVFGFFFCLFAVNMFYKTNKKSGNTDDSMDIPENYNWKLGTICSVGVGFLASILGIGGGVIHVPMMTYLLKFPVKRAVATSTVILAVSAVAGTTSHAALGHIDWIVALCLGAGACIGAQIGVLIASKVKSKVIVDIVAALVLMIGIKFLFEALG